MLLREKEVSTIEEAFALMPRAEQEHSKRVAEYTEAAFVRAASKELFADELYGKYEMVIGNREFAFAAGLYHDIGKLMDGDHNENGPKIIEELFENYDRLKPYHARMLRQGASDHHEFMDGSGRPEKKIGKAIGYMGRFVAIADEIDHRAMSLKSENPIGDVLKSMRSEIELGHYDESVFKCYTAAASSLKKTFDKYREKMPAIPQTEAWIKKKGARPMELGYRLVHNNKTDDATWFSEMRFRDGRNGYLPYSEVMRIIAPRKLGPKLGDYFTYELCDALRRFETCKVPGRDGAIELPKEWYNKKFLKSTLDTIFADEKIDKDRVMFLIPEEVDRQKPRIFRNNLAECSAAGYRFLTPEEAGQTFRTSDAELQDEESIIREKLSSAESEADR